MYVEGCRGKNNWRKQRRRTKKEGGPDRSRSWCRAGVSNLQSHL